MDDRRHYVSFDPRHFEKRDSLRESQEIRSTFREIYKRNHWAGEETVSGPGSEDKQTAAIKRELPLLLDELNVTTLLDLPCGDLHWIGEIDLPVENYIGADIVPGLIQKNHNRFADSEQKRFEVLDLTADPLPNADIILCRDCLVHFSFEDIEKAIRNLKTSPIEWLLTTTFTDCKGNKEICTGDWRVLNLEAPPFNFPSPHRLINEQCTEGDGKFSDKSLALWRIRDLPEI